MISYTITAVDIGMSSVGGSPTEATLRTPPIRGVSWASTVATHIRTARAASTTCARVFIRSSCLERGEGVIRSVQYRGLVSFDEGEVDGGAEAGAVEGVHVALAVDL